MVKKCSIYEDDQYKFIDFSNILYNIYNSFLDDISDVFECEYPMQLNKAVLKRYIKHNTLVEILKLYEEVDSNKLNGILISNNMRFNSNSILADDSDFILKVLKVVNSVKRNIPLLIKNVDCAFNDIDVFLESGEGIDFIMDILSDKEKLKRKVISFEQFKKFAKKEQLTYITDNLINKMEFKRLFIS